MDGAGRTSQRSAASGLTIERRQPVSTQEVSVTVATHAVVAGSADATKDPVSQHVEHITSNGRSLAYIIRGEINPLKTTFLTPPELKQQVGFVVYPAGGEVDL